MPKTAEQCCHLLTSQRAVIRSCESIVPCSALEYDGIQMTSPLDYLQKRFLKSSGGNHYYNSFKKFQFAVNSRLCNPELCFTHSKKCKLSVCMRAFSIETDGHIRQGNFCFIALRKFIGGRNKKDTEGASWRIKHILGTKDCYINKRMVHRILEFYLENCFKTHQVIRRAYPVCWSANHLFTKGRGQNHPGGKAPRQPEWALVMVFVCLKWKVITFACYQMELSWVSLSRH